MSGCASGNTGVYGSFTAAARAQHEGRGDDTLTPTAWERFDDMCSTDDRTDELSAAWGIKEQLRRLLTTDTLAHAWDERMRMGYYCQIANMLEATKLYGTVVAWWEAIEVLIVTGATNARVEVPYTGIKYIKRTGRGFRNPENYRMRILLTSAARTVARIPAPAGSFTTNREEPTKPTPTASLGWTRQYGYAEPSKTPSPGLSFPADSTPLTIDRSAHRR
ncbi:transposase [Dermabacter hominis]|nr:transposase [Dermabacter hominis]